ncbi:hypothetical protein HJC23_004972 [Cyclotella cryptica]|uniref:Helicase-associated domain-containing protein n=1 Tax=Cyclotella cryptica TaxID=29204 RepID=A0ABD3PA43_9STRA|eukprot:CCRYP_016609-RD/>CCRYP_016609-RD protein AED:0.34 eAED:0.34 QI:243/1/1/1/0.8/0.66/6/1598/645
MVSPAPNPSHDEAPSTAEAADLKKVDDVDLESASKKRTHDEMEATAKCDSKEGIECEAENKGDDPPPAKEKRLAQQGDDEPEDKAVPAVLEDLQPSKDTPEAEEADKDGASSHIKEEVIVEDDSKVSSDDEAPLPPDESERKQSPKSEAADTDEPLKLNPDETPKDEGDSSSDDEAPAPPEALKIQFLKPKEELIDAMSAEDSRKFHEADSRRMKDDKAVRSAHSKLLKAKNEAAKAQQRYEECQRIYAEVKAKAEANVEKDADDLLLEPTSWNTYYRHLKTFYDREGHCNFKRTITDSDVAGLSDEAEKELRTLSWWTCRQRKFRRRGELEPYKIHLLDRINFEWNPHAGPGPEKWMKSFNLLKEFKEANGHVKVPVKHIEGGFKLGSWLKTQITQYRNAKEGRQPALSAERIKLLEDIGVSWGEKRLTTPWESRFEDLLEFKRRFGHANVPWQWKENVSLAQWVNSQRKKYKDLADGKRNNLSVEQISRLNGIGFKWSTGGRGRYNPDGETALTSVPAPLPGEPPAINGPNPLVREQGAVAATAPLPNTGGGSSGPPGPEGQYPPHPQYFTNRFPGMDPQLVNEHYRFAQQNDPNFSYLQYAYHMNQLNNQFNNPAHGQIRDQMNQMFPGNGQNPFAGPSNNA